MALSPSRIAIADGDDNVATVTSFTLAVRGSPGGAVVTGIVAGVVLVGRCVDAGLGRAVVVLDRRTVDAVVTTAFAVTVVVVLPRGAIVEGNSAEVEVVDSLVVVLGRTATFLGWLLHAASSAPAATAATMARPGRGNAVTWWSPSSGGPCSGLPGPAPPAPPRRPGPRRRERSIRWPVPERRGPRGSAGHRAATHRPGTAGGT